MRIRSGTYIECLVWKPSLGTGTKGAKMDSTVTLQYIWSTSYTTCRRSVTCRHATSQSHAVLHTLSLRLCQCSGREDGIYQRAAVGEARRRTVEAVNAHVPPSACPFSSVSGCECIAAAFYATVRLGTTLSSWPHPCFRRKATILDGWVDRIRCPLCPGTQRSAYLSAAPTSAAEQWISFVSCCLCRSMP